MKKVDVALKVGTGAACAWETTAIVVRFAGGPDLTISHGVGLQPWLGVPILAGLAVHLYWRQIVALVKRFYGSA